MSRVIIFGGYGVFGSQVAAVLAAWGTPLTIAGRDLARAEAFARGLGGDCQARMADIARLDSCRTALAGHTVAVNCAGPFQRLDATLLEACLKTGCHYVDIADDRGYTALVRSFGAAFADRGLAAVYGCSSLPGISGALALIARDGTTAPVERTRVTLFIGNRNPKGQSAIRSLVSGLGMPIMAPQGVLRGFHGREVVALPAPFGRRGVFDFDAPDYDLFPSLHGTKAVTVKVGFELRLATYSFALLARIGRGYGPGMARLVEVPARLLSRLGHSGGAVMTQLFLADGSIRRAAVAGSCNGQRMAALPCAQTAQALQQGFVSKTGSLTAYEFLGARALVERLIEAGYEVWW